MSDKTTYQKNFEVRLLFTIDSDTTLEGIGAVEAVDLLNRWWQDNAPIEIGNGVRLDRFAATTPKVLLRDADPLVRIEDKVDQLLAFHELGDEPAWGDETTPPGKERIKKV